MAPTPRTVHFRVTLPLPPSVNDWLVPILVRVPESPAVGALLRKGLAVRTPKGIFTARIVKSMAAKKWLEKARELLAPMPRPRVLFRGVLECHLTVYVPSLASDGGNRLKLPEDALKGLVIDDDRQFVLWRMRKDIDAENPRAELEVRRAVPEEHPRVAERLARAERELEKREARAQQAGLVLTPATRAKPARKKPAPKPATPPTEIWRSPAPADPARPTYGARHGLKQLVREERKRVQRKEGGDLKGLARPASYRPGEAP